MKTAIHILAITGLVSLVGCATQEADQAAAAEDDPKVCKRVVPTGSRLGTRVCMRQSEWDAQSEESSEEVRVLRRTGNIQTGSPN